MKKPNVEYDQMIKEVAREVNRKSNGKQLPWKEGISLNDFYFGGRGGKGKVQTTPPVANVPIKNKTVRKPGTLMPTNKYGMEFVYIPEGEFLMGSTETEVSEALSAFRKYFDNAPESWVRSEYPQHWVKISRSFEMMRYEVTQGQWEKVMRTTVRQQRDKSNPKLPMYSEGINYPMYYVSWDETQEFIKRLNEQRDGYSYRLPTEAEWEYAARAGTTSRYYWGNDTDETEVCRYANLADQTAKEENPKIKTMTCRDGFADLAPVGSFASNSWGLYDMSGNVWEWVKDWYSKDYYGRSSLTDPGGPKSGSNRVRRGGSWSVVASSLRSANRLGYSPDVRRSRLGFRLVRTLN
jgi:formylglycine-generating enzyme required for sulfatase activity